MGQGDSGMAARVNKGGRPRKLPKEKTLVGLELPDEMIAGYERWLAEVQRTVPGGSGISRADLMRDVLAKALEEHEGAVRRAAPAKPSPAPPSKPAAAKKPLKKTPRRS